MTSLQSGTQYCPHQSHDGIWTKEGKRPATRSLWPGDWRSFAEAAAAYNGVTQGSSEPSALPELDITLEL